jgi:hypothetical protein
MEFVEILCSLSVNSTLLMRFSIWICLLLACPFFSVAQSNVRLILDTKGSAYFGAENIQTLNWVYARAIDKMLPPELWKEERPFKQVMGFGYRFSRLILLDYVAAHMLMLVQHEVYGHGARLREFGVKDIAYQFHFPPPLGTYGGRAIQVGPSNRRWGEDEELAFNFSGSEATSLLSSQMEARFFEANSMHHQDALLHLYTGMDMPAYILSQWLAGQLGGTVGGDPGQYMRSINQKYVSASNPYNISTLARQSLVTFLNPFDWYSIYTVGIQYLVKGNTRLPQLPTIGIGSLRYLPALSYNLTPFGSEFILYNYVKRGEKTFVGDIRVGDNRFESHWGADVLARRILESRRWEVSLQAGGWHQPPLHLGGESIYETKGGLGGYGKAHVAWAPTLNSPDVRLYLQGGYKSAGYVMGEPLASGPILRFGLDFRVADE